jgi:hypothetical protein
MLLNNSTVNTIIMVSHIVGNQLEQIKPMVNHFKNHHDGLLHEQYTCLQNPM